MAENIKSEDMAGSGMDWRAEASGALADHDADLAVKRGRGRPKGASNRKTVDFAAWYEAQGFKDPLQLQAEFMSADPIGIQAFFCEHERTVKAIGKGVGKAVPSLGEIVKEQLACARDIAPYLHGKAPVRLEVSDERLPFLVINAGTNQLDQAKRIFANRGLSVGTPINKNNGLAIEDAKSSTVDSSTEDKGK